MLRFLGCCMFPAVRDNRRQASETSLVLHILSMQKGWLSHEDRLQLLLKRLLASDPESHSLIPRNATHAFIISDFAHAYFEDLRHVTNAVDFLDLPEFSVTKSMIDWKLLAIKRKLPEYLAHAGDGMYRYIPKLAQDFYHDWFSEVKLQASFLSYAKNKFQSDHPTDKILAVLIPADSGRMRGGIAEGDFGVQRVRTKNGGEFYIDFRRKTVSKVVIGVTAFLSSSTGRAIAYITMQDELCLIRRNDANPVFLAQMPGIKLVAFTPSPTLDLLYVTFRAGNILSVMICPSEGGTCRLLLVGDSLVEIDGDFLYLKDGSETTVVELRETPLHRTRFPDVWHAHDIKQAALGNAVILYDATRSRLFSLFAFICFSYAEKIQILKGALFEICEAPEGSAARWKEISDFIISVCIVCIISRFVLSVFQRKKIFPGNKRDNTHNVTTTAVYVRLRWLVAFAS